MKIEVKKYADLRKYVEAFAKGNFNLLFLVGNPGISKTSIIKRVIPETEAVYVNAAQISPFRLYQELYENKDKTFVLDDCDQLWTDRGAIRLMKALCQTESVRTLEWGTTTSKLDAANIPFRFKTKSRVVIINNRWRSISEHVESLEDRGLLLEFNPPPREVLAECKKWFEDKEILKVVSDNLRWVENLSMRQLYHAQQMRKSGLEWEGPLLENLGVPRFKVLDKLMRATMTDAERERKFIGETKLSRSTYYEVKKTWQDRRRINSTTPSSS